jgi:hypothetical protein
MDVEEIEKKCDAKGVMLKVNPKGHLQFFFLRVIGNWYPESKKKTLFMDRGTPKANYTEYDITDVDVVIAKVVKQGQRDG